MVDVSLMGQIGALGPVRGTRDTRTDRRPPHEGHALKDISDRWTVDAGKLAAEVVDRLQRNGGLADLGLGEVDGRIDLRELETSAPDRRRPTRTPGASRGTDRPIFASLPIVRKLRFSGLDLSGAVLPEWLLRNVEMVDCRFDGAKLRGWAMFGGRVLRTTFQHTDLRGALLGNGTTYEGCSFRGADLGESTSAMVTFQDVDFRWADLNEVEFPDSRFVRCRFGGRLHGTIFGGEGPSSALDGNDFREAELLYVDFRALDLRDIVPPEHPDDVIIENVRPVLESIKREIDTDPSHALAWLDTSLDGWLGWIGPSQRIGIVHRRELALDDSPEGADAAVAIIRRVEREVGGS